MQLATLFSRMIDFVIAGSTFKKLLPFPNRNSHDASLSFQQHTWQYMGPNQSLTSFSLSFGAQKRTQIDLFPVISCFNNLELMRFVMELHP